VPTYDGFRLYKDQRVFPLSPEAFYPYPYDAVEPGYVRSGTFLFENGQLLLQYGDFYQQFGAGRE
jgi:hypothetical protein